MVSVVMVGLTFQDKMVSFQVDSDTFEDAIEAAYRDYGGGVKQIVGFSIERHAVEAGKCMMMYFLKNRNLSERV